MNELVVIGLVFGGTFLLGWIGGICMRGIIEK